MKNISILIITLFSLTASAQDPCDGITFQSITYDAFTDTAVIVHLTNNGPGFFSYPGFILISSQGDTFAMENVNFFGIGQESIHSLEIRPGVMNLEDIFNGTLELHTGFYDSLRCSWPINQSFCPPGNCANLIIGMQNWGGALVTGDFEYFLDDTNGNTIETGTYTMIDTIQYWEDTLCVPVGEYYYSVFALEQPSGGGPVITVAQFGGFGSPMINEYLDWYNGVTIEVPFYLQCEAEEPNSIGNASINEKAVTLLYHGDEVSVKSESDLAGIVIYDMKGRLVNEIATSGSSAIISNGLVTGTYVAQIRFILSRAAMKKFIIK